MLTSIISFIIITIFIPLFGGADRLCVWVDVIKIFFKAAHRKCLHNTNSTKSRKNQNITDTKICRYGIRRLGVLCYCWKLEFRIEISPPLFTVDRFIERDGGGKRKREWRRPRGVCAIFIKVSMGEKLFQSGGPNVCGCVCYWMTAFF